MTCGWPRRSACSSCAGAVCCAVRAVLCAVVAGIHEATCHSAAAALCFGFWCGRPVGAFCVVWVCVDTRAYGGVFLWAVGGEALGVTFCCCSTLGRVDAGAMSLHVVGQGSSRSTRLLSFPVGLPSASLPASASASLSPLLGCSPHGRVDAGASMHLVGQGSTQLLSLPLPPRITTCTIMCAPQLQYANCGYQNCIARCDPVSRGHLLEFAIQFSSPEAFVVQLRFLRQWTWPTQHLWQPSSSTMHDARSDRKVSRW